MLQVIGLSGIYLEVDCWVRRLGELVDMLRLAVFEAKRSSSL